MRAPLWIAVWVVYLFLFGMVCLLAPETHGCRPVGNPPMVPGEPLCGVDHGTQAYRPADRTTVQRLRTR